MTDPEFEAVMAELHQLEDELFGAADAAGAQQAVEVLGARPGMVTHTATET